MPAPFPPLLRRLALPALALLPLSAPAGPGNAHEHGSARLEVVVDAHTLAIRLESPLHNLVGFEHAPRTPAQHEALARLHTRLHAFTSLFTLPAAAGCELTGTVLDTPHRHDTPAHTPPVPAAHPDHSDLSVDWQLQCTHPDALQDIVTHLHEHFPAMTRIRVQTATPGGQGAATLGPGRKTFKL